MLKWIMSLFCSHRSTHTTTTREGDAVITRTRCVDCGRQVRTPQSSRPTDEQISALLWRK